MLENLWFPNCAFQNSGKSVGVEILIIVSRVKFSKWKGKRLTEEREKIITSYAFSGQQGMFSYRLKFHHSNDGKDTIYEITIAATSLEWHLWQGHISANLNLMIEESHHAERGS